MMPTPSPATDNDSDENPVTIDGGITRLNATDGLFLRAEHLAAMQDYARELAYAAGLANGTGVVYGFTVRFSDEKADTLEVSSGLAIDPTGRPLRSNRTAFVSLSDLVTTESDPFWVLEILPTSWVFGTEKAFGNLCDDPCNGSTITPWQAEGLTVRLRQDFMPGLGSQGSSDRRSWLASQYFERERQRSGPWLTPSQRGDQVSPISRPDWSEGNPPQAPAGVPLAVLQRIGDKNKWVLDVWTARRDVGDPPARRTWQWRLGMRPWNVFLAQVLQFQAQLAEMPPAAGKGETVDPGKLIANLDEVVQGMAVKPKQLRAVVDALKKAAPTAIATAGGQSLQEQGFVELPPAGFLPVMARGNNDPSAALMKLFVESNVDVRICHCRADYVPHTIEQAQHLDRIPLDPASNPQPAVDVLVPDWPPDLASWKADHYGWVAFTRRRDARCVSEPPTDKVKVYFTNVSSPIDTEFLSTFKDWNTAGAKSSGTLLYPADSWAYPGGGEIVEQLPLAKQSELTIVALTYEEQRRPLATLRASLFAASFDNGIPAPAVYALASPEVQEAIFVFRHTDFQPSN